jgi:hypothetical protein
MTKLEDNLSNIFDIEPKLEENVSNVIVAPENINSQKNDIESDYNIVKNNIHGLINKGNIAIDNLLNVAKESEHPRAYEVAANLLKTLAEMNKDLLDIQKKKKDLTGKIETNNNMKIDKAVFVGSTDKLIDLIKGKQ